MPTTPTNIIDYRIIKSIDEGREVTVAVTLAPSLYYPLGCALCPSGVAGQLTVSPAAGTGTPVAIMPVPATTDANGNITFGTPNTATQYGYTEPVLSVLAGGLFATSDLYTQSGAPGAWVANNFTPGNGQQWATIIGSLTSGGIVVK